MQKTTLVAIIVAAVIVVCGAAAVVIMNNNNSSETADTIVGHTFEYKVVGNYEGAIVSGTQKVTVLSEKDERYEVKTERNIYADTSGGTRTVLWNDAETEWKNKTDITKPGTYSKEYKLSTYWGTKTSKVYTSTVDSVKTTSYVLYDKISFETVVEDGDNLYIYMMNSTDFMKGGKSAEPKVYKVSFDVDGTLVTADSSTYALGGNIDVEIIDATGTANEVKNHVEVKLDTTTITNETTTSWELQNNSDSRGTKSGTSKVSTIWGVLDTTVYTSTKEGATNTSYYYKDIVPVKMSYLYDNGTNTIEFTAAVTEIAVGEEKINTLDDLNKLIDGNN